MTLTKVTGTNDDVPVPVTAGQPVEIGGIAAPQLRSIVDRIERMEEEKKAISGDIKEIYDEAKGSGFDAGIIRKVIAMRKRKAADLDEEQTILDLYLRALNMLPS